MSIIEKTILSTFDIDFEKLFDDFKQHINECKADAFTYSQFHYWLIETKFYKKKFISRGSSHGQKESDDAREEMTSEIITIFEEIGLIENRGVNVRMFTKDKKPNRWDTYVIL